MLNVQRTIRQLIAAGCKGCFLEDQAWPKRMGHMRNKEVIEMEEFAAKVGAGLGARGWGWEEAGLRAGAGACCHGGAKSGLGNVLWVRACGVLRCRGGCGSGNRVGGRVGIGAGCKMCDRGCDAFGKETHI